MANRNIMGNSTLCRLSARDWLCSFNLFAFFAAYEFARDFFATEPFGASKSATVQVLAAAVTGYLLGTDAIKRLHRFGPLSRRCRISAAA